jgi:hypothetical protein
MEPTGGPSTTMGEKRLMSGPKMAVARGGVDGWYPSVKRVKRLAGGV